MSSRRPERKKAQRAEYVHWQMPVHAFATSCLPCGPICVVQIAGLVKGRANA